ncbi:MAG TPA: GFA family protein [Caulobacteraceae bacterium]|nr:GFA family protein [Caulobacteraceae bacterium]
MPEPQRHKGSCHCGAIRFTVETALEGVIECDCSHCWRKGFLLAFVPAEQFALESGEDALSEYRFNRHAIEHRFCKICGVQPFGRGTGPDGAATVAVNVRTLEDVEPWSVEATRVNGRSF